MPQQGWGASTSGGGGSSSSKGSKRRRRRVFGGKKKPDPEKHSLESRGVYADGVAYGVASWVWRFTANTLSRTPAGDDGRGGAGRGAALGTTGGGAASGDAGIALLVAVAAAAATLLLRFDTAAYVYQ